MSIAAEQDFRVTKQISLDSTGSGTATITVPNGNRWLIEYTSVATSTSVNKPIATTYRGSSASQSGYIEDTYKGWGDTSDTKIRLNSGESITCVWTGGDSGAVATLIVAGVQTQLQKAFT